MKVQNPPSCPFHRWTGKPNGSETPPSDHPVDSTDPTNLADKLHDPRGGTIPCPWWKVMINTDQVHVDDKGNVSMKELRQALKKSGLTFGLRETALIGIKRVACHIAGISTGGISGLWHVFTQDKINVLDLPKSELMHTGDSGTLRGGFHQENLDRLLGYSTDGQTVTLGDLARANKDQVAADPGESGRRFGVAEYSILLNVFGKKNEAGEKYLSKDDLTRIFKENQFPEDWHQNKTGFVGFGRTLAGMFGAQKEE